jgi:multidrug efflux pump subunit AcrA (membrane-fusion protein)
MFARLRALRWYVLVAGLAGTALLLAVAALSLQRAGGPAQSPASPEQTPAPRLIARGRIVPVAQARIGTQGGGVVLSIAVAPGDTVQAQQEIARVRGPAGIEVLAAPWAGTITSVPVQAGDTVLPGTVIATLADMSRLQIETTDVDEFLIPYISKGQPVTVTVDALDQRVLQGYVRTVALQQQASPSGDLHYPVTIDLVRVPPDLRIGMMVRVQFVPRES